MRAVVLAAAAAIALMVPAQAQRWTVQYAHRDAGERLQLVDLAFPSIQQGLAIGTIVDRDDPLERPQPIALVTGDGGITWSRIDLDDTPVSVFFRDPAEGWMVGHHGLWRTADAGNTWSLVSEFEPRSIERVWFLDSQRGFAVGRNKRVLETTNAGTTWTPVEEASEPTGNPEFTHYTHIAFADGRRGLVVGAALPPVARVQSEGPADGPLLQAPVVSRQGPTLTLQLQTLNGGMTWTSSTAPLFGHVTGIDLATGEGLVLFDYDDRPGDRIMEWPSEVYRINLRTGASNSTYRDKDHYVTSVLVFEEARGYLGSVHPVSGAVRMLQTAGMTQWDETPVDARAVGTKVFLAGPDADHVWAATDTGFILYRSR